MPKLPEKELELLRKLLGMTTSRHDGEALVAIRKANELLVRNKVNWEEVFETISSGPLPTKSGFARGFGAWDTPNDFEDLQREANARKRQENARKNQEREEIEEAFEVLKDQFEEGTSPKKFLDSLFSQWQKKGYLTPKQQIALMKFAKRFKS